VGDTVTEDLGRAELLALPILILLSLLFFRGRAATMPLIVGLTTILGTFLALTAVKQAYNSRSSPQPRDRAQTGAGDRLRALEGAGLIVRERNGRNVIVHRTARGTGLLALYDEIEI
jgi:hypothetical protein